MPELTPLVPPKINDTDTDTALSNVQDAGIKMNLNLENLYTFRPKVESLYICTIFD